MKAYLVLIAVLVFSVSSRSICEAGEPEIGDNWMRYTFKTNDSFDVGYISGGPARTEGWAYPTHHQIYPGCILRTKPVTVVGKARIKVEITFHASQWLHLSSPLEISQSALFGVTARWAVNGRDHSKFVMIPSQYLQHWQLFSGTDADMFIYFVQPSGFELPYSLEEINLPQGADGLTISACAFMDMITVRFSEIKLTVFQDQEF